MGASCLGVTRQSRRKPGRRYSDDQRDTCAALYDEGRTIASIAVAVGMSAYAVQRALVETGVRRRHSSEYRKGTGAGRSETLHAYRKRRRMSNALAAGRAYIPRAERLSIAEEKRRAPKPPKPESRKRSLMRRYLAEHPEVAALGMAESAIAYRARYLYDDAFRAKEIERLHRKKTAQMPCDGTLDAPTIRRLFASASECLYCGRAMRSMDKTLDHVEPRSSGGWHSVRNAVICCKRCNTAKGAKSPALWISRLPVERRDSVRRHLECVIGHPVEQAPLGFTA